jgi:hypothetical protein
LLRTENNIQYLIMGQKKNGDLMARGEKIAWKIRHNARANTRTRPAGLTPSERINACIMHRWHKENRPYHKNNIGYQRSRKCL